MANTQTHPLRVTPEPTYDVPFSVAVDDLTGYDFVAIKEKFKSPLSQLPREEQVVATVWCLENRGDKSRSIADVRKMTSRELANYFPAESNDAELGKESNPEETTPEN